MKKNVKRLALNRETLHALSSSPLGYAIGGRETGLTDCVTRCASYCCGDTGSGSPTIFDTCGVCSNGCATGGACTVTC